MSHACHGNVEASRIIYNIKAFKMSNWFEAVARSDKWLDGVLNLRWLYCEGMHMRSDDCDVENQESFHQGSLSYEQGRRIDDFKKALEDSKLKDEALRNKAIMEGLIRDDESSNDCWKRWKSHEIYYHNYDDGEYKNETHEEGHQLCGIETHKVPVCQIKRYKMIKYLFNDEEEYVAVKEDEYDDLTITREEACRAYQEIFRMMDEGWMVTRTE
ncbi:hypothetical protein Tco_0929889 [Tanacetum coccineum]